MMNVGSVARKGQSNIQYTFFQNAPALSDVRQELFNDSFPTQLMGRQSLCQVSEKLEKNDKTMVKKNIVHF